jgi:hypothetical protein
VPYEAAAGAAATFASRVVRPAHAPARAVLALSFGADDGTLYASGTNVPVQKYDITLAHLTAEVCKRAGSGLSKRDWKTYLPNVPYRRTC